MVELPYFRVIDANVAVRFFQVQPGTDRAEALFGLLASSEVHFFVPDFFYAECASAFTKTCRAKLCSAQDARESLDRLLKLRLHAVPASELAEDALKLALKHGISGYDAFYVALSKKTNCPLVTADAKLARALNNHPFAIELL